MPDFYHLTHLSPREEHFIAFCGFEYDADLGFQIERWFYLDTCCASEPLVCPHFYAGQVSPFGFGNHFHTLMFQYY